MFLRRRKHTHIHQLVRSISGDWSPQDSRLAVLVAGKGLRSHIISVLERIFLDTEESEFALCNRITSAQLARNWTTRLVPGIACERWGVSFLVQTTPTGRFPWWFSGWKLTGVSLYAKFREPSKGSGQQSCWIIHHIYNDDEAHTHTHIHSSICVRCLENGHFLCWRAESGGRSSSLHRF